MELPNPLKIIENLPKYGMLSEYLRPPDVYAALLQYGAAVRDATLEWAAENANIETVDYGIGTYEQVDRKSILSGKTHKDLAI